MQQLLSSQVLTFVEATVRESPRGSGLVALYCVRNRARTFSHPVAAAGLCIDFSDRQSALLACERRAGTNRDAE